NRGQAWDNPYVISNITPNANCVYAVAPLPPAACGNTLNCVYAATKAGLWAGLYIPGNPSTMSWTQIPLPNPIGPGQRISSIFYPYAANPLTFYIGLATGDPFLDRILKTTDGGASWSNTAFLPGVKVNALGGLPSNANTFYAAYTTGDLFKTTDG